MDDLKWLIAREIPHLRRYARALLHDTEAADDLVQDCLERALRKRHLWRRRGSIRNWLFRILYHTFINSLPQQKRKRSEVPLEQTRTGGSEPARQDAHLEWRDMTDALAQLPDQQRAAILLVALEGLSYDEAADVMDVPVGTVRSRLSRGRETLRTRLRGRIRPVMLQRVK